MFGFKKFIKLSKACLVCALVGIGLKAMNATKLSALEGERTYFLDSPSSQALIKTELSLFELARVKGECVSFEYEGTMSALSEEILSKYDAELQFIEEVDGIISYYAYTPLWREGLQINGYTVNLHIALSQARCVVGTPIIFGGF